MPFCGLDGFADQLRGDSHRNREPKEWSEILRRGHAGDEQSGDRCLEMIVKNWKTVSRLELLEDVTRGEDWQA